MDPEELYETDEFKNLPFWSKVKTRVKLTLISYLMNW
mgnify:CR=1 FL=1|jgi:hypothetical protein